jgi:hypothetical protein
MNVLPVARVVGDVRRSEMCACSAMFANGSNSDSSLETGRRGLRVRRLSNFAAAIDRKRT